MDGRGLRLNFFLLRKECLNVITFRIEESLLTNKTFRSCLVNYTDNNGLQVWCLALSEKADISVVKASEKGVLYIASTLPVVLKLNIRHSPLKPLQLRY